MRSNVGVIGLGIIGRRVVANLRKKGFPTFVWNRTPRPVPNFVGSPAELAQTCDVLEIFVADDDALLRVVQQMVPKLGARHIVVAHPTVSPDSMRAVAEMVEKRKARFVEAPFTGSKIAAEKGELVYYVAGDAKAIAEVRPVLEASSKAIVEIGEIGDASIVKVATNMVTAATVQAAAEAMALTERAGVSLDKFFEAMRLNASHSPTLEMKIPRIVARDFEVHFSTKHMLKDMLIGHRLARISSLDLNVADAARERLQEQMRDGRGDDDFSSVARKYFADASTTLNQNLELFTKAVESPLAKSAAEPPPENKEAAKAESADEVHDQPAAGDDLADVAAATPECEMRAETARADIAESEAPQRGFLRRLLRRPGDS